MRADMKDARQRQEFRAVGAYDAEALAKMLAAKIGTLPASYIAELEDFVDFLVQRAHEKPANSDLNLWAACGSEAAFAAVWNNPEDDVYDAL